MVALPGDFERPFLVGALAAITPDTDTPVIDPVSLAAAARSLSLLKDELDTRRPDGILANCGLEVEDEAGTEATEVDAEARLARLLELG